MLVRYLKIENYGVYYTLSKNVDWWECPLKTVGYTTKFFLKDWAKLQRKVLVNVLVDRLEKYAN